MQTLSVHQKRVIILRAVMLAKHACRLSGQALFRAAADLRQRAIELLRTLPHVTHRAAALFLANSGVRETCEFGTSEIPLRTSKVTYA